MLLTAGSNRLASHLFALCAMANADNARSGAAALLPLFPKERPLASEVSDWIDAAKPSLPPDQRALIDGLKPRAFLSYAHATVPATRIASD